MKKGFAIILALCMVLSLAACGGGKTTPSNNSTAPANNSANTVPANSGSNTPAADDKGPDWGKKDGSVYTNEYYNLKVTLPSDWQFQNDEQVASNMGTSADIFKTKTIKELAEGGTGSIYMMQATAANGTNIIVSTSYHSSFDSFKEADILAVLKDSQAENLKKAESGFKTVEYKTVNFAGQDKQVVHIVRTASGIDLHQYMVIMANGSDYVGIVTITQVGSEEDASIWNMFSTLK